MFTVVNLSGHPVTDEQLAQVGRLRDDADTVARDISLGTFDPLQSFTDQIESALKAALAAERFPDPPYAVLPPGNPAICALALAMIHGLVGHFPTIVRLREAGDGRFEVAELTDLQTMRNDVARRMRPS